MTVICDVFCESHSIPAPESPRLRLQDMESRLELMIARLPLVGDEDIRADLEIELDDLRFDMQELEADISRRQAIRDPVDELIQRETGGSPEHPDGNGLDMTIGMNGPTESVSTSLEESNETMNFTDSVSDARRSPSEGGTAQRQEDGDAANGSLNRSVATRTTCEQLGVGTPTRNITRGMESRRHLRR